MGYTSLEETPTIFLSLFRSSLDYLITFCLSCSDIRTLIFLISVFKINK